MSITRQDVRQACFVEDLQDATELTLARRGLIELGACISECTGLTALNLSFNSLVSTAQLSSLCSLSSLNLSHNSLTVCSKAMSHLTALTQLNVAHNKIVSIQGVAACTALQELWLQNNRISTLSELQPLAGLPHLARLCISPNPLTKQFSAAQWRATMAAICPQLKVLDGLPVSDADRKASEHVSPLAWTGTGPSTPVGSSSSTGGGALSRQGSNGTSALPPPGPSSMSTVMSGLDSVMLGLQAPSRTSQAARARAAGALGAAGRQVAGSRPPSKGVPAGVLSSDPLGSPGLLQRRGSRGSDTPILPQHDDVILPRISTAPEPLTTDESALAAEASDVACSVVSWDAHSIASGASSTSRHTRRTRQQQHQVLGRIKELPTSSKFQSVLAALPQLPASSSSSSSHYQPSKMARARHPKPPPPRPPPDAHAVVTDVKYSSGHRGRAVRVCKDGSACMSWPNGDLAITVDAEYGISTSSSTTYRMLAMYRHTGNVAVSWDSAAGGFVQYPNGSLCLNCASHGAGTLLSPTREVLLKWADSTPAPSTSARARDGVSQQQDEQAEQGEPSSVDTDSIPEPRAVQRCNSSSAGAKSAPVDVALDSHLGVRFCRRSRQLQVFVACEGIRYVLVCGHNPPDATWQVGQPLPAVCQGSGHDDAWPPPPFLHQLSTAGSAAGVRAVTQQQHRAAAQEANSSTSGTDEDEAAAVQGMPDLTSALAGLLSNIKRTLAAAEESAAAAGVPEVEAASDERQEEGTTVKLTVP